MIERWTTLKDFKLPLCVKYLREKLKIFLGSFFENVWPNARGNLKIDDITSPWVLIHLLYNAGGEFE